MLVNPLNINVPIVDPRKGTPTAQFMQTWQQSRAASAAIPVDAAGVSALLDLLGNAEGDMLRRGPSSWLAITSPGGTTQFLRADGDWAVPAGGGGGTLAGLSDVAIPAPTDGQVLTYDAGTTKWEAFTPTAVTPPQNPLASKWRILINVDAGDVHAALNQLQLRSTPGGANLSTNPLLGSVSSTYSGYSQDSLWTGTPPGPGMVWNGVAGQWGEYDFIAPVSINEVVLQALFTNAATWITDFNIEYWDGAAWQLAWHVTGAAYPGAGLDATFTDPAYGHDKLVNLSDVSVSAVADGDVITWDAATGKWENKAAASSALTISTRTGDYTLVLADAGSYQRMNKASTIVLTIPPNASAAFAVGTVIKASQLGAGQLDLTPFTGVSLNALPPPGSPYGIGEDFTLIKVGTDEWDVLGHANIVALVVWVTNVNQNVNVSGTFGTGVTLRNAFPSFAISPAPGTTGRITFQTDTGCDIGEFWLGTSSTGTEYHFDAPPIQLTFGGSPSISAPASSDIVTDPFVMPTAGFTNLLMSWYLPGPAANLFQNDIGVLGRCFNNGNEASMYPAMTAELGNSTKNNLHLLESHS